MNKERDDYVVIHECRCGTMSPHLLQVKAGLGEDKAVGWVTCPQCKNTVYAKYKIPRGKTK